MPSVQTDPRGVAPEVPRTAAQMRLPKTATWRWASLFTLRRRRGSSFGGSIVMKMALEDI
jgi:hypothetical protein